MEVYGSIATDVLNNVLDFSMRNECLYTAHAEYENLDIIH